jgi:hypothetical protein
MLLREKLPLPADRTVEGPEVTVRGLRAVVKYDWEGDDGQISWATIEFSGVLALTMAQESVLADDDILPSDTIASTTESARLVQVLERWEVAVAGNRTREAP